MRTGGVRAVLLASVFLAAVVFVPGAHALAVTAEEAEQAVAQVRTAVEAENAGWTPAVTPLSGLTVEEARKVLGSLVEEDVAAKFAPAELADAVALPARFDWRNVGGKSYVTPVKSQGSCGSCWAFAETAALESKALIAAAQPGEPVDLSEGLLLACSGAGGCGGGNLATAADYIKRTGLPSEYFLPYDQGGSGCDAAREGWRSWSYRVREVHAVAQSATLLKAAVHQYGPLVVAMTVYEDFHSYGSGVYRHVTGGFVTAHAVALIGWDDAARCFIAKNSWGEGWGEAGFFRISYDEVWGASQFGHSALSFGDAVLPAGAVSLAQALDNAALPWRTGVAAPWIGVVDAEGSGGDAARNAPVGVYGESWLRTTVAGPADIAFTWGISAPADDYLHVSVDGERILRAPSSGQRERLSLPLGPGSHKVTWTYSNYFGSDTASLDQVAVGAPSETLAAPAAPTGPARVITNSPVRYAAPPQTTSLGHSVRYRFDWGDGTVSDWGFDAEVQRVWPATGTFRVRAQTSCASDRSLRSPWSLPLAVTVALPPPMSLGQALDNTALVWETGGTADWRAQNAFFESGGDAAQSGTLPEYRSSWIQTTVAGPAVVAFSWARTGSSVQLGLAVDGTVVEIAGAPQGAWRRSEIALGPGPHTLKWTCYRWTVHDDNEDYCWLDRFEVDPFGEVVGPPTVAGPGYRTVGEEGVFTAEGASSNQGHTLEYRFRWDEEEPTPWSPSPQIARNWAEPFHRVELRAQARCAAHPSAESEWSLCHSLTVEPPETITPPQAPSGPVAAIAGMNCSFGAGGASSSLRHSLRYQFDWGDGTQSPWLGSPSYVLHRWVAGLWEVRARARCDGSHGEVMSEWSAPATITVSDPATVALAEALDRGDVVLTTGGTLPWLGLPGEGFAGDDAARSGAVDAGQASWMEAAVAGPTNLSFWWRRSQDAWGDLTLRVDGAAQAVYAQTEWRQVTIALAAGLHQVRWEYAKQTWAGTGLEDSAWVDRLMLSDELLAAPYAPSGPSGATRGVMTAFTATGGSSSLGHPLEYRFAWGDGSFSPWSATAQAEHAWSAAGSYLVHAQARCILHPETVALSSAKSFWVGEVPEVVTQPDPPTGPATVFAEYPAVFTAEGAVSNLGRPLEYQLDPGTGSALWFRSTPEFAVTWSTPGTYQMRTQARSTYPYAYSPWSDAVTVEVVRSDEVTVPAIVEVPAAPLSRTSYEVGADGAVSTAGHAVEYRFDWGGGRYSEWLPDPASSVSWYYPGTYQVRVRARCAEEPAHMSLWSDPVEVVVAQLPEVITVSGPPSGPAEGFTLTSYGFTGRGSSNLGGSVRIQFDWGDGDLSSWVDYSASHAWTTPGSHEVRVRACPFGHPERASEWSEPLTVVIAPLAEIVTPPAAPPSGPVQATAGIACAYVTGAASCNHGHPLEYAFSWGDGTESGWSAATEASHAWTAAGPMEVRTRGRCSVTLAESAWTGPLAVQVFSAAGLDAALGSPGLTWETGGTEAGWAPDAATGARSGPTGDDRVSWLRTVVRGPARLDFSWRVSSEPERDSLVFFVDGVEEARVGGEALWAARTTYLPSGSHVLLWVFRKDGSGAAGEDAGFLAGVVVQAVAPSIRVTAPARGSVVGRGRTLTARWTARGVGGPVEILLQRKAGARWLTTLVARNAPGTGRYAWTVPRTQPRSAAYRLKVTSSRDAAVRGASGIFEIR